MVSSQIFMTDHEFQGDVFQTERLDGNIEHLLETAKHLLKLPPDKGYKDACGSHWYRGCKKERAHQNKIFAVSRNR